MCVRNAEFSPWTMLIEGNETSKEQTNRFRFMLVIVNNILMSSEEAVEELLM